MKVEQMNQEILRMQTKSNSSQTEMEKYFPGASKKSSSASNKQSAYEVIHPSTAQSKTEIEKEILNDPERKRLYDAAQSFQSIFIEQMLSAMRKNLNKESDMLYGGQTEEIFTDYLYQEYAKGISKQGNFGLAEQIYAQMSQQLPTAEQQRALKSYEQNLHPSISTQEMINKNDLTK
jgi:peptidoglycan hydrolase FlgJ